MTMSGRRRYTLKELLSEMDPNAQRTDDDQAWLDMEPVGLEFGSPDWNEGNEPDRVGDSTDPAQE